MATFEEATGPLVSLQSGSFRNFQVSPAKYKGIKFTSLKELYYNEIYKKNNLPIWKRVKLTEPETINVGKGFGENDQPREFTDEIRFLHDEKGFNCYLPETGESLRLGKDLIGRMQHVPKEELTMQDFSFLVQHVMKKEQPGKLYSEILAELMEPLSEDFQCAYVICPREVKFCDLLEALKTHIQHKSIYVKDSEIYVWIDIFCTRALQNVERSDTEKDQFRSTLEEIKQTIPRFAEQLVYFDNDETPMVFDRLWCIFEMYCACVGQPSNLSIIRRGHANFDPARQGRFVQLLERLRSIDPIRLQSNNFFDADYFANMFLGLRNGFSDVIAQIEHLVVNWLQRQAEQAQMFPILSEEANMKYIKGFIECGDVFRKYVPKSVQNKDFANRLFTQANGYYRRALDLLEQVPKVRQDKQWFQYKMWVLSGLCITAGDCIYGPNDLKENFQQFRTRFDLEEAWIELITAGQPLVEEKEEKKGPFFRVPVFNRRTERRDDRNNTRKSSAHAVTDISDATPIEPMHSPHSVNFAQGHSVSSPPLELLKSAKQQKGSGRNLHKFLASQNKEKSSRSGSSRSLQTHGDKKTPKIGWHYFTSRSSRHFNLAPAEKDDTTRVLVAFQATFLVSEKRFAEALELVEKHSLGMVTMMGLDATDIKAKCARQFQEKQEFASAAELYKQLTTETQGLKRKAVNPVTVQWMEHHVQRFTIFRAVNLFKQGQICACQKLILRSFFGTLDEKMLYRNETIVLQDEGKYWCSKTARASLLLLRCMEATKDEGKGREDHGIAENRDLFMTNAEVIYFALYGEEIGKHKIDYFLRVLDEKEFNK